MVSDHWSPNVCRHTCCGRCMQTNKNGIVTTLRNLVWRDNSGRSTLLGQQLDVLCNLCTTIYTHCIHFVSPAQNETKSNILFYFTCPIIQGVTMAGELCMGLENWFHPDSFAHNSFPHIKEDIWTMFLKRPSKYLCPWLVQEANGNLSDRFMHGRPLFCRR